MASATAHFRPWPAMGPAGTRARWTGRAGANDTFHCRRSGLTPLPGKLDILADSAPCCLHRIHARIAATIFRTLRGKALMVPLA
jgi:hypothetical protein